MCTAAGYECGDCVGFARSRPRERRSSSGRVEKPLHEVVDGRWCRAAGPRRWQPAGFRWSHQRWAWAVGIFGGERRVCPPATTRRPAAVQASRRIRLCSSSSGRGVPGQDPGVHRHAGEVPLEEFRTLKPVFVSCGEHLPVSQEFPDVSQCWWAAVLTITAPGRQARAAWRRSHGTRPGGRTGRRCETAVRPRHAAQLLTTRTGPPPAVGPGWSRRAIRPWPRTGERGPDRGGRARVSRGAARSGRGQGGVRRDVRICVAGAAGGADALAPLGGVGEGLPGLG